MDSSKQESLSELLRRVHAFSSIFSCPVYSSSQYGYQKPLLIKESKLGSIVEGDVPDFTEEDIEVEVVSYSIVISSRQKPGISPISYKIQLTNQYDLNSVQWSLVNARLKVMIPKKKNIVHDLFFTNTSPLR